MPLIGRRIPIVADEYSDPEKGSGAVKITPAHDFSDFEVGKRHGLAMPSVLDRDARIDLSEVIGDLQAFPGVADLGFVPALAGLDRTAARRAIVAELERLELVERIEPHVSQVPHGDRSGVPIEPLLTVQWYCDAATLAKPALAAVETGQTVFFPKQWENTYFAWLRDIQPWCISRQLWWGHRIPAWYGPDGAVFVAETEADARAQAANAYGRDEALNQDEDVLDTWFSSALWPFSTLGWPSEDAASKRDVERYYPGDVLVTGFDIIFFWVARMMMMGLHVMGEVPFRTVYIHGLVRDERGQKMSKSKGNVVDPLALIDLYGADALRWAVCTRTTPGRDVKLGAKLIEQDRGFVTKLWNAARFCEMNAVVPVPNYDPASARLPLARWVLDAASRATADATEALEAFRIDEYAAVCYRFVWNDFCDWFLELAKPAFAAGGAPAEEARAAAGHVLGVIPAPAASDGPVRDRGALGPARLRAGVRVDRRTLADAVRGHGRGRGAGRARLGRAAGIRSPHRAKRDGCVAGDARSGLAEGRVARIGRACGRLGRQHPAPRSRQRSARDDGRGQPQGRGADRARRGDDRAAASRVDRHNRRTRTADARARPRGRRGGQNGKETGKCRVRVAREGRGGVRRCASGWRRSGRTTRGSWRRWRGWIDRANPPLTPPEIEADRLASPLPFRDGPGEGLAHPPVAMLELLARPARAGRVARRRGPCRRIVEIDRLAPLHRRRRQRHRRRPTRHLEHHVGATRVHHLGRRVKLVHLARRRRRGRLGADFHPREHRGHALLEVVQHGVEQRERLALVFR